VLAGREPFDETTMLDDEDLVVTPPVPAQQPNPSLQPA
jgi:hypothetical protein